MFIARTQRPHTWKSPSYTLTEKERQAWQNLVGEAQKVVNQQETSSDKMASWTVEPSRRVPAELHQSQYVTISSETAGNIGTCCAA